MWRRVIDSEDFCSLGGVIVIFVLLGNVYASPVQKRWGSVLALVAFLGFAGYCVWESPPSTAEWLFHVSLRALSVFGLVLGLSWCILPLVFGFLGPIWRRVRESAAASRRAWEDLQREWERQDQLAREAEEEARMAPQRELERLRAEEAAKEQEKAQRRRDDARAVVVFCYEQQSHLLVERLPRARIDELMKQFLADSYPPEVVEHRAIELQNLILGHVHKLEPPAKKQLESEAKAEIAETKAYYEAHKDLLQRVYPPALLASYLRLAAGAHLSAPERIAACHKLIELLQDLVQKEREKQGTEETKKQSEELERQKLLRLIRAHEEEIEELRKRGGKPDVVEEEIRSIESEIRNIRRQLKAMETSDA